MTKQLFIQKADDSGNLIIKPIPGQVICEFDPIPEAKEYAEAFTTLYNKFPNGFASWYETHHEVVCAITQSILLGENEPEHKSKATIVSEEQGTGGLYELGQELTDKFEKLHEGREWDGEFFDEIEDFLQKELK